MAISIKKCPHCGVAWSRNYSISIGSPLVDCSNCDNTFIDPHVNEWELKSPLSKAAYLGVIVWTSILVAMAPLLLLIVVLGEKGAEAYAVPVIVISFCVAFMRNSIVNGKHIGISIERMKNPEYRKRLVLAGLLKG